MIQILLWLGLLLLSAAAIAAAKLLFACHHPQEIFDRYPDGQPALRCTRCLRLRPNILGRHSGPGYHRTQEAPLRPATGIDRFWAELDHPITDEDLFDLVPASVRLERHPERRSERRERVQRNDGTHGDEAYPSGTASPETFTR